MPVVTPESCSYQDPYFAWEHEDYSRTFGDSEQGQDQFFEAYEANLRQWTDEKYPRAREVRPHVSKAFTSAMEFIVFAGFGVRGHTMTRLPAKVEWIVWHGFATSFEADGKYRHEDIRGLMEIYFRANADPWKKLSDSNELGKCLTSLSEVEKLVPYSGRHYFRGETMKMIGEYL